MIAFFVIFLMLAGIVFAAYKKPLETEVYTPVQSKYVQVASNKDLVIAALNTCITKRERNLTDEIKDLKEQVKYYATGQHELKDLPEFISLKDFNKMSDKWKTDNIKFYKVIKSDWAKQSDGSYEENIIGYELNRKKDAKKEKSFRERMADPNDPMDDYKEPFDWSTFHD